MGIKDEIKADIKESCSEKDWQDMKKYFGKNHRCGNKSGGNAVYCLGLIGAAVYFIGQATSFSSGVLGLLKALVWPAFLVYEAFKFLAG